MVGVEFWSGVCGAGSNWGLALPGIRRNPLARLILIFASLHHANPKP